MPFFWLLLSTVILGAVIYFSPGRRVNAIKTWGSTLALIITAWMYLAWLQHLAGCDFSFGHCYSEQLPDGHNIYKSVVAISLYAWWGSAGYKIIKKIYLTIRG